MYATIPPSVYLPAFSGSIESDKDLRIAFRYLHDAKIYAHFLILSHRAPLGMTVITATKQIKRHIRSRIQEYYNTCNRFSVQYLCRDKELVLYKVAFNTRYTREDAAGLLYGSWDRLLPPGRTIRVKWAKRLAPDYARCKGGVTSPQHIAYVWIYDPYYRIKHFTN